MGLINPPKKKKRRTDQYNDNKSVEETAIKDFVKSKTRADFEYENEVLDKYKSIKDAIKSKPKKSKFAELKKFLIDKKDNEDILQEIAKDTDHEFITKLLIAYTGTQASSDLEDILQEIAKETDHEFITKLLITYTGTQASSDLVLFDILKFYERNVKFNFKPLLPLVCGPNTELHYANLVKLGRAVHICPKPDEVLSGLNSDILWETGISSSLFNPEDSEQKNPLHYDPRYISMLLLGMVEAGADLTLRLFVEKNGLSFAAFLLSHPLDSIRIYGYAILSDFLLKIQDISSEAFLEKPLFTYTLIYLKDNLKQPNLKIGNGLFFLLL
uniref:Uncharacterized protein n=1 Tax=Panagrolaimus sp. PS1159 TaxID=55785 RepID=A0AC35GRH0_9BILA